MWLCATLFCDIYLYSYMKLQTFLLMFQFDVGQWLQERKPRLVERSQIIELAGKALATAGQVPTHETLTLHGVLTVV